MRFLPRALFAKFAVTPREWRLLDRVHDGPASAADLGDLAELVEGFVSRGWAKGDPVALTPEGERVHAAIVRNSRLARPRLPHPRRPL